MIRVRINVSSCFIHWELPVGHPVETRKAGAVGADGPCGAAKCSLSVSGGAGPRAPGPECLARL